MLAFFWILVSGAPLGLGLPTMDSVGGGEGQSKKALEYYRSDGTGDVCEDNFVIDPEFKERAMLKLREIQNKFDFVGRMNSTKYRGKRDHGYDDDKVVIRCKSSYTGLLSFFAVPLLMGDIMLDFMSMIDISVEIEVTTAATTTAATTAAAPNNNNNNNNNGGEAAEGGEPAEGNNNNNNNPRSLYSETIFSLDSIKQLIGSRSRKWEKSSPVNSLQNNTYITTQRPNKYQTKSLTQRLNSFLESYFSDERVLESSKSHPLPLSGDWTDRMGGEREEVGPWAGVVGWRDVRPAHQKKHQLQQAAVSKRFVLFYIIT